MAFEGLGVFVHLLQHKAADVPELVREVPRVVELVLGKLRVRAHRDAVHQRIAERVRSVLLDEIERAHHVAERLAHLDGAHAHETVEIDGVEGDLSHVLEAEHDHPRDPEKQDVVARLEDRAGVVALQVGRLVRPPERAERPQPR